ncbi:hypothetical protein BH10ACT1_BH10ACT1_06040 [soil metagenome]
MGFVDGEAVDLRVTGDREWELLQPLTYEGREQTFVVPAGSSTDLASVPGLLTWLVPRYGRYTKSAILHDFLWRTGAVPRSDADGIFRRSMRELGVPILRRWAMWGAVRAASVFRRRQGETRATIRTRLAVIAVALAVLPVVVLPAITITLSLVVMWVAEHIAALIARLVYVVRPERRRPVNTPHILDPVRQG